MAASSRLFLFCAKIQMKKKTEVMELANYPQYNYQPQPMGYQPQMQPMY